MKRFVLFMMAVSIILFSCSDKNNNDDGPSTSNAKGNLVVTVYANGTPVSEGIKVLTEPYVGTKETDAFGQVIFENIGIGNYTVYSYIQNYGSGKTYTEVKTGINTIVVQLLNGVYIEPLIEIISPVNGQGFALGDEVVFTALVYDNNTEPDELKIEWESDVDGYLGVSHADTSGKTIFKTAELSASEHFITVTVTNNFNIPNSNFVYINTLSPRAVKLSLQQASNSDVTLSWVTTKKEIDRFEIYQYSYEAPAPVLLATLDNQQSTWVDHTVPYADSVYYYIKCYNPENYFSKSNTVSTKGSPYFDFSPEIAAYYPGTEMLYVSTANQLRVIDYKTSTVVMEKSLVADLGDFSIADNGYGNEFYAPCSDGWIYIYDLSSFQQKETINVGVPVECIVSNGNGLLYSSVSPNPWWEQPLRVFNRDNLFYVDGGGDFDNCRLRILPSGNEIIEITRSVSPIDMDYYLFDDDGNILLHKDDAYHGDHPLNPNIYKVAPAQNYLVTAGEGAIYQADETMLYLGMLPSGNDFFTDFEFNDDASVIYAGVKNNRKIDLFDYPSMNYIDDIVTKGNPIHLFRDNNTLIVLSTSEELQYYNYPNSFGVEVINLETKSD